MARRADSRRGTDDETAGTERDTETAATTTGEAGEGTTAQVVGDDLNAARRDYCLAMDQAWVDATRAWWKAYADLAAAQHRTSLDAGLRRSSAYHIWYRAVQEAGHGDAGGNSPVQLAYDAYQRGLEDVARTARTEWERAQQAYRAAVADANKAYSAATEEGLRAYLAQIQRVWGSTDTVAVDPGVIARLAQASNHAAQVAQALRWARP